MHQDWHKWYKKKITADLWQPSHCHRLQEELAVPAQDRQAMCKLTFWGQGVNPKKFGIS